MHKSHYHNEGQPKIYGEVQFGINESWYNYLLLYNPDKANFVTEITMKHDSAENPVMMTFCAVFTL